MNIRFDPEKDRINRAKHHISLDRAREFDFRAAKFALDASQNYGEVRWIAVGFLGANLHTVVFTEEDDESARIISLKKAEPEERRDYEEEF